MHDYADLIRLFNECFEVEYQTTLVCGDDEPIYLPADAQYKKHRIIFANQFFSSALHECAHWFVAGAYRRTLIDYGYWYVPDGRTPEQQSRFEQVEVKPQALEYLLSKAAGFTFQFSIDNLNGKTCNHDAFKSAVHEQVLRYQTQGLPKRAHRFYEALSQFYAPSSYDLIQRTVITYENRTNL
jgi:hypothetical protein